MLALAIVCFAIAWALPQIEDEDYIMVETKEFGAGDNAIKIEFGVRVNGSGPCLRIEVPFEEGEEEKMAAVGKLIEILLRQLGIIESPSDRVCPGCGEKRAKGQICNECKEIKKRRLGRMGEPEISFAFLKIHRMLYV